ncbi:hypothetical protein IWZ00DRAFT_29582 [Phyllosticta capitalensis]
MLNKMTTVLNTAQPFHHPLHQHVHHHSSPSLFAPSNPSRRRESSLYPDRAGLGGLGLSSCTVLSFVLVRRYTVYVRRYFPNRSLNPHDHRAREGRLLPPLPSLGTSLLPIRPPWFPSFPPHRPTFRHCPCPSAHGRTRIFPSLSDPLDSPSWPHSLPHPIPLKPTSITNNILPAAPSCPLSLSLSLSLSFRLPRRPGPEPVSLALPPLLPSAHRIVVRLSPIARHTSALLASMSVPPRRAGFGQPLT